jgi:uncharacterized protein (TIGR04255 family)
MADRNYDRPPIIEAIIEVKFEKLVDAQDIAKVTRVFTRSYQNAEKWDRTNIDFRLGSDGSLSPTGTGSVIVGSKHTRLDRGEIAIVSQQLFLISQLPDYPGWESLFARFREEWKAWKDAVGYQKIQQIGLRYINRVDIPTNGLPASETSAYLKVYAEVPADLGPALTYAVQAAFLLKELAAQISIASQVVPSPIPDRLSILLDISVSKAENAPQRDDDMFTMLQRFRVEKNRAFEMCLTDRARDLFGHA